MRTIITSTLILFLSISILSQSDSLHDVLHVKGSVYTFRTNHPKFGNPSIVASIGKEGVFLADVGPQGHEQALLNKLEKLGSKNVKYIVTTHHHGDHTEGLEFFSKNEKITIISPAKQRKYLGNSRIFLKGGSHKSASLPKLIFEKKITVYLNNEEIEVFSGKNPNGHTGGDAFIYFKTSNVLYLGDYVFLDHFPIIDLSNGGSIDGFLENMKTVTEQFADSTVIVPGHGTLAPEEIKLLTIKDLKSYYKDLSESVTWIRDEIKAGNSLEKIQEKGLPEKFNSYNENYIYINNKRWIKIVYEDNSGKI